MTTTHTVLKGQNLSVIAATYGYKNWRIIYYADENTAFRANRPDPYLIHPGDKVVIPDHTQHAFIDARPHVERNNIPLFTQAELTCWKACGQMLYLWRYPSATAAFNKAAGKYLTLQTGLVGVNDWVDFYCARLGMQGTPVPGWNLLFHILASRSPAVVMTYTNNINDAHAMVLGGYDLRKGKLYFLNPAAGESFTFD